MLGVFRLKSGVLVKLSLQSTSSLRWIITLTSFFISLLKMNFIILCAFIINVYLYWRQINLWFFSVTKLIIFIRWKSFHVRLVAAKASISSVLRFRHLHVLLFCTYASSFGHIVSAIHLFNFIALKHKECATTHFNPLGWLIFALLSIHFLR